MCAVVTCALLPAYTIRWHVAFYPSTVLEDAIVVTALVFAIESRRARMWPTLRSPFALPAAIFLLAGLADVVIAPDRRAALGIYRAYLIEPILFFVVLANVVRLRRQASILLAGLAVSGAIVSVTNILVILDAIRHHVLNVVNSAPVAIFMNANDVPLF